MPLISNAKKHLTEPVAMRGQMEPPVGDDYSRRPMAAHDDDGIGAILLFGALPRPSQKPLATTTRMKRRN